MTPAVYQPWSPGRSPSAPSVPASAKIRIGEDGRIVGADGMLDQIAGALARHAGPMVRRDVLPVLQNDRRMQVTIGAAVGRELASQLLPWLVGAVAVGLVVFVATRR